MRITLAHRHYGVHEHVAEAILPGEFSDYATPVPDTHADYVVDEDKLIAVLPDGFLPVPAKQVLLAVSDDLGGTGQRGLSRFKDWAKYFDAYCLNLFLPSRETGGAA